MLRQYSGFLLVTIFCHLVVSSSYWMSKTFEESNSDIVLNKIVLNKIVATIIENCHLGLESIIVYVDNNNQFTFEVLSNLKIPVTKLFMSGKQMINTIQNFYDVKNQGLVLAMNTDRQNVSLYNDIMFEWRCEKNCTVIIIPLHHNDCNDAEMNLFFIGQMSIYNTYYVCTEENTPVIYTYDLYGDTKPSHWKLIFQKTIRYNTFTLYNRPLKEDAAGICKRFLFERTNITQNNSILVAIDKKTLPSTMQKYFKSRLYDEIFSDMLFGTGDVLDILKKLTKVKFVYYVGGNMKSYTVHVAKQVLADITFQLTVLNDAKLYRSFFIPTYWNNFVILSHNRGLKTPLEKISHFYGLWILLSLIGISVLAFIIICCKMRKNIAFAAYDVLRLLINSGVSVPIDTLSLKLFFSMIFLYFMVIHATFNGNLAKFLTIPEYHKNIDSFKDLTDPQITVVYCMNNICDNEEYYKLIHKKYVPISDFNSCISHTIASSSSACVGVSYNIQQYVANKYINDTRLYISKEFEYFAASYRYRKQFILTKRFNKALMYMNDIGLSSNYWEKNEKASSTLLSMNNARSEIKFRAIAVKDLKFAFIFLIIGNSLSLVCFIIEITAKVFKCRNKIQISNITT